MNILRNKDILSQFADVSDFSNTINGGVVGPKLSIQDNDDHMYIKLHAPSVAPESMKVTIEGNMLVVAACIRFTRREEADGEMVEKEATVPYFFRSIPMPAYVNAESIQAAHEGDTLHIKLEYISEENRKWKNIPIRKVNS